MAASSRRAPGVVGLVVAALAAAVLTVTATAAAPRNGLTFAVKVPPAGSVSWLLVRLVGTLKPGATLPAHLDLRQLAKVENAAALPRGLAVYGAARVGRSGSTIAIRELLVVLNPRSSGKRKTATAEQEQSPARTVKVMDALDDLGYRIRTRIEWEELEAEPLVSGPLGRGRNHPAGAPSDLESPDSVIASTPSLVAGVTPAELGSWEDGHAFGWKVTGSPAGSINGAAVVNDLDATIREIIDLIGNPTDEAVIEGAVDSDTAKLARDAALPPGSLELAPPASAAASKIVVVDDVAGFQGSLCTGGGKLELSWVIHGAQPGAKLVIAMTGPGIPSHATITVGANGAAAASYPISGSGTWTDKVVSVGGQKPSGAIADHAKNTCN
jgi:hypothetical protein